MTATCDFADDMPIPEADVMVVKYASLSIEGLKLRQKTCVWNDVLLVRAGCQAYQRIRLFFYSSHR